MMSQIKITEKNGQLTIEQFGRTYIGLAGLIASQVEFLEKMRSTTPNPRLLARDLAVYRFILAQEDRETSARAYVEKRKELEAKGKFTEKMDVAKALGWKIE